MKPTFETSNDRELLQELHRLGSGTVQELCDALGVTATAVRQRLVRLQGSRLIGRETLKVGRGRPSFVYRLTETGTRLLGENYGDLVLVLWRELQEIHEPELRERIVARVRDALVERYGNLVDGQTLDERVAQLTEALSDRGFQVESDCSSGLPVLRENNCPYPELASRDPSICRLEQQVFERILGDSVTLAQCCRNGDHCCEFQAGATL